MNHLEYLNELAKILRTSPRSYETIDDININGIQISNELALNIADRLDEIVTQLEFEQRLKNNDIFRKRN